MIFCSHAIGWLVRLVLRVPSAILEEKREKTRTHTYIHVKCQEILKDMVIVNQIQILFKMY